MISTLSILSPFRSTVNQAQAALTQTQTEISSGVYADLGLSLGAQTGNALSLESEIDNLGTFTSSNAVASTRLSATSITLDSFLSSAQTMQSNLIQAGTAGGLTDSLTTSATDALNTLISGLNTSVGGQYIFAGTKTQTQPVSNYSSTPTSAAKTAVDAAYKAFVQQQGGDPSTITGPAMQTFLSTTFANLFDDSGWQNWSKASSTPITSSVSPTQSITTSASANQAPYRQLAQAYTMLAEFTNNGLGAAAQAAVISTATTLTATGTASLNNAQASIGISQASIANANSVSSAQVDILKTNVGSLTNVDPLALNTKLTALQTQLEASYELTSRLQSLSLTNYLTGG